MTSLCSLAIIIPEIWKLDQTSFQGCFVIYTLRSKLPRTTEKSIRRLKESIIKFLQEIFQSISAWTLPDSSRVLKKPQVVMATLYKKKAFRIIIKAVKEERVD